MKRKKEEKEGESGISQKERICPVRGEEVDGTDPPDILGGDNVEGEKEKEYLNERFNFACVLRGEVKHLEKIKEYVVSEYVNKGLVKLIKPTYEKKEIYILTDEQWKEYQKLKKKDERLIGAGFP